MMQKGSLYVESKKIQQGKIKQPEMKNSIEETSETWRNYYKKQFPNVNLDDLAVFYEIDEIDTVTDKIGMDVSKEDIEKALKKCKMNAAPGPSGITYRMLKIFFEYDPD